MKTYTSQCQAVFTRSLLLLSALLLCHQATRVRGATDVQGTIVYETWTKTGSPYNVVGDIFVAAVTIDPGVTVNFRSNYNFEIAGTITAIGTAAEPVVFHGTNGWQGLFFNEAYSGSEVAYCVISNSVNSGIRILNSTPLLIRACVVANNSTAGSGGGISANNAAGGLTVSDCIITNNTSQYYGGGISANYAAGDLTMSNCVINNNTARYHGGGIAAILGTNTLRMSGCLVAGNVANPVGYDGSDVGGGIYVSGNSLLQSCVVRDNLCQAAAGHYQDQSALGGGFYSDTGMATLRNCTLFGNQAACWNSYDGHGTSRAYGGGFHIANGSFSAANTIMASNLTTSGNSLAGAGLYAASPVATGTVVNCTIAYNNTEGLVSGSAAVQVLNSILYFNNSLGTQLSGPGDVTYCDVQGGFAGPGNIDYNPIFLSTTSLLIVSNSLCMDAGKPAAVYNDTCFPPSIGTVRNDIGAYGGSGACAWAGAFNNPRNPSDTNVFGTIVNETWTKANSPYNIVGGVLVAGLTIQPGVVVNFQSDYAFEVAGTIKAVGTAAEPIVFRGTNTGWQGIFFDYSNPGSELAYCVISNSVNGGIRVLNSTPLLIRDCVVANNSTAGSGGGISANNAVGDLTVSNCIITNNTSQYIGGGISANNVAGDLTISNCIINNNTARYHGGGIAAILGTNTLRVSGCLVAGNVANPAGYDGSDVGGGIYVSGNSLLQSCVVRDNVCLAAAGHYQDQSALGGGFYSDTGMATLRNCTLFGNQAACWNSYDGHGTSRAYGGGFHIASGSFSAANTIMASNLTTSGNSLAGAGLYAASGVTTGTVVNCTIAYNNTEGLVSGSETMPVLNSILYFNNSLGTQLSGTTNVTYCDVQGGFAGLGNTNVNPIFRGTTATNFALTPPSRCIDGGNPDAVFNDTCFPPSLGTARNDIGAYGGPGACGWIVGPTAPSIVLPPTNQNVVAGATAVFRVTASGTEPLSYQWWRFGTNLLDSGNISGSRTNVLTLTNVQPGDVATNYFVVVTNVSGSATSTLASLTVVLPVTITTHPLSQIVDSGTDVTFTVGGTGTLPFTYQWWWNGSPVSGATNAILVRSAVTTNQAGNYYAVMNNIANIPANSSTGVLTVIQVPTGSSVPEGSGYGSFTKTNNTFTVIGGGEDIEGTDDRFFFVHLPWTGDGEIMANLTSLAPVDPHSEAGLMFRDGMAVGARHVLLAMDAGNQKLFRRRLAENAYSVENRSQGTNNVWLKLMRMGDTFTGHYSTNGVNWELVWWTSQPNLPATLDVGLAVTAHLNGSFATAVFDMVGPRDLTPLSGTRPHALQLGGELGGRSEFQRVGGFKMLLDGEVGAAYNIKVSPTVNAPFSSWSVLGIVTNTFGVVPFLDAQALTNGNRFYRGQKISP